VLDAERVGGAPLDPCKVALDVSGAGWRGYDLADALAERGIVVEKASLSSVLLLVPYGLPDTAVRRVTDALTELLAGSGPTPVIRAPSWPAHAPGRIFGLGDGSGRTTRVSLAEAVGRECAEVVECYPPGIPVLVPGEEVTDAALSYLLAVRSAGGSVVAADPGFATIAVAEPAVSVSGRRWFTPAADTP
jgi:arginine/lysine/ornithine decarboxylase